MNHEYTYDVCVVGAGHIGLPWAASLAYNGFDVVCVDIDEDLVAAINNAEDPYGEPELERYLERAIADARLHATTSTETTSEAKTVTLTLNAANEERQTYYQAVEHYAAHVDAGQTIINRTTLPVQEIEKVVDIFADALEVASDRVPYVTFPERLAQGHAITEINTLPKLIGAQTREAVEVVEWLLSEFDGEKHVTDGKTAMFAKLMDNAYRDARFAIANQFALLAEECGINPHEVVELANADYPRNDIPEPGTVGGNCLTKDPHFLTDRFYDILVDRPDLFRTTRAVHRSYDRYIFEQIVAERPEEVAILGTAFKRNESDESNSPSLRIRDWLLDCDIDVECYDPVVGRGSNLKNTIRGADVVFVGVNHSAFEREREQIRDAAAGRIIDIWGVLR
jgi:UDP-N-acetyl-D-mannosaminuronic acid dehydrogenase